MRLILVLGMHRSGTSVICRSLQCLGVELGTRLIGPAADNPKGFFEDRDIVSINQRILRRLGGEWNNPPTFDASNLTHLVGGPLGSIARRILGMRLQRHSLFAVKDPRMCLLLRFWRPIIKSMTADVSCVLVLRDPFSVAASLYRRNDITLKDSLALWLRYTLTAATELDCSWNSTVVDYNAVLDSPYTELTRVAERLHMNVDDACTRTFVDQFLDRTLCHGANDERNVPTLGPLAQSTYNILSECSHREAPLNQARVAALIAHKELLVRLEQFW